MHLKFQTSEMNNTGVSFDSVQPNQQNRDSFGLLVEAHSAQSSLNSNISRDSIKKNSTTRNENQTDENEPQPSTSKGLTNGGSKIFSPTKRRVYGRSPLKNTVRFFFFPLI